MVLTTEQRLTELLRDGRLEAELLQWEYLAWRRRMGFDPPAERLNRWHLAWDELGEALGCA